MRKPLVWSIARDMATRDGRRAARFSFANGMAEGLVRSTLRWEASRERAFSSLRAKAEKLLEKGKCPRALALYYELAKAGDHASTTALVNLPGVRDRPDTVEAVYRAAVAGGDRRSLSGLAAHRARQGDSAEARAIFAQAIDAGLVAGLTGYAAFLRNSDDATDHDRALAACRKQVAAGQTTALPLLGALLLAAPESGNEAEAEAVLRRGAALLDNRSRCLLAALLLRRGEATEATRLIRQVRITGDEYVRDYADRLATEYDLPGPAPALAHPTPS